MSLKLSHSCGICIRKGVAGAYSLACEILTDKERARKLPRVYRGSYHFI